MLEPFQSLIGILMNCNTIITADVKSFYPFQSLIGILMNCNGSSLKPKLYLVFKVRLHDSRAIIALENLFGKSASKISRLKSYSNKHLRGCADNN